MMKSKGDNMKTELDVLKETIKVEGGNVSFRTRSGRGSGCGVSIPAAQFAEFMRVMAEAQQKLTEVPTQQTPIVNE